MLASLEDAERVALFDIAWLDRCPLFDPYRNDPQFAAVRASVAARADAVLAALTTSTR